MKESNKNINLVSEEKREDKLIKKSFFVSLALFILTFSLAVATLSYSFLLRSTSSNIESKISDLRGQMIQISTKRDRMLVISERLSSIKKVIATRKQLGALVNSLVNVAEGSFQIDSVSANDKEISIAFFSPSLLEFESLITDKLPLFAKSEKSGIQSVTTGGFSRTNSGYTLIAIFKLN